MKLQKRKYTYIEKDKDIRRKIKRIVKLHIKQKKQ
jgi:hypothetical protein